MIFDMSAAPPELEGQEISQAQARDAGIRPRAIPLFPANLLAWAMDRTGRWLWAKTLTSCVEQPNPLGAKLHVDTITLWGRDEHLVYEFVRSEQDAEPRLRAHRRVRNAIGEVPIVIFRARPAPNDKVRGVS